MKAGPRQTDDFGYVDDLDARVAAIRARGLDPAGHETYGAVRKVLFRDPEGNEIGFGGGEA